MISSRRLRDLQDDELSFKLFELQPEAFSEIDERINKLAEYICQNCPQEDN